MHKWQKVILGVLAFGASIGVGVIFSPFGEPERATISVKEGKAHTAKFPASSTGIERPAGHSASGDSAAIVLQSSEERRRVELENLAGTELLFAWDSWLKLLDFQIRGVEIESVTINGRNKLLMIAGYGRSDLEVHAFQSALLKMDSVSSVQLVEVGQVDGKSYPLRFDMRIFIE